MAGNRAGHAADLGSYAGLPGFDTCRFKDSKGSIYMAPSSELSAYCLDTPGL